MPNFSVITPVSKKLEKQINESITDPRWAKFFYYWMESGNSYRAGIKAGFSPGYSTMLRQRIPKKVKNGLLLQLEKQGISDGLLANRIKTLLVAKTPIYKNNNATKQVELVGMKDDTDAIDKGLKHALAIRGDITDKSTEPQKHLHLHMDLSSMPFEKQLEFATTGKLDEQVQ